jgi:hypothetical protein
LSVCVCVFISCYRRVVGHNHKGAGRIINQRRGGEGNSTLWAVNRMSWDGYQGCVGWYKVIP